MSGTKLKIAGIVTTIVGAGISILSGIISDKQRDETIDKKVKEAFASFTEKKDV